MILYRFMEFKNKYEKWYWSLINKAINRDKNKIIGENHHVFPKCIYGDNKFVVKLTYKEHYIAHLLLAKFMNSHKLWLSIIKMRKFEKFNYNSSSYERTRKEVSKWRSEQNKTNFDYEKALIKTRKNNSLLQNRPWKNFNKKKENIEIWKKADLIYKIYVSLDEKEKRSKYFYIIKYSNLDSKKYKIIRNMVKLFDNGWEPSKDQEWILLTRE